MDFQKEFEKYAVKDKGISSNTLHAYRNHQVTNLTPNIIEERPMNVAVMDVYSRLMMDRIIFLGYPINDEVANIVTAQLLFLESTDRTRDIQMYINSPGGSVYSGLGVYDTMQYITPDVSTICIGMAASMAAVLLTAGSKGKTPSSALKAPRSLNEPVRWVSSSFSATGKPSPSASGLSSSTGVLRTCPVIRPAAPRPRPCRRPQPWGRAIETKSSASSRTASSTPFSIATSRTVRFELAASLTISAAAS